MIRGDIQGRRLIQTMKCDANRYHFNQEQVNVAVTGANIIKVGSASIAPAASVVLMETSTDNRTKLTSSVTLTLTAAAAASS